MKTIQEQVKYLNELNIEQTSEFIESIPEEVYTDCFENAKELKSGIDIDKHRWYETSITVYDTKYGKIAVKEVSNTFSEEMGIGDCSHTLEFFEVEEVTVITYKIKK